MSEVNCPLGGCGYEGAPSSVEAHISRMTDSLHKGEVGRAWREALDSGGSGSSGSSGSIPAVPVSGEVVFGVAVLVVLYLILTRSGESEQEDQQEDQNDQQGPSTAGGDWQEVSA